MSDYSLTIPCPATPDDIFSLRKGRSIFSPKGTMDHTRLPPEIWIHVIINFSAPRFRLQDGQTGLRPRSPKTDLFHLSLVSTRFRQLCQPYVFDRLSFRLVDGSGLPTLGDRISTVSSFMDRRPEIKQWIRAISLIGPPDRVRTTMFNPALTTLFTRLENIETVYISNWTVVPSLLSGLNLDQMREIVVESSLMEQFHAIPALQPGSLLRYLWLDGIFDTHAAEAFAPLIRSPGLKRLGILRDNQPFLSTHLRNDPNYKFGGLLQLTIAAPITPFETRCFMALVQQCPEIHSLHIYSQPLEPNPEPSSLLNPTLPIYIFSKLTEFVGPLSIACRIVRDRPISRIIVDGWQDAPDVLTRDLLVPLMPTVPITLLHLRAEWWTEGLLETIADLFPALEDFSLKFSCGDFSVGNLDHFAFLPFILRPAPSALVKIPSGGHPTPPTSPKGFYRL